MLFNSYEFIFLFLPIVLVVFYAARALELSGRFLQVLLAVASFTFFWTAGTTSIILLSLSVAANYEIGRWLVGEMRRDGTRRALIGAGVAMNVLLLASVKYGSLIVPYAPRTWSVVLPAPAHGLPLAISFYTFLQIAYLVDCYRERGVETYSRLEYLLFVMFFPHLIAGPLVHHRQLIPQLQSLSRTVRDMWRDGASGCSLFVIGLSKKVLIADTLSGPANTVFEASLHSHVGSFNAAIAISCYTLQIYFDFSGYSDMAIGLSRMLGIILPENFRSPYQATSIVEFWRRWHITLSQFLRQYVYVPLGGNRRGRARRYVNLLATMLLGGAWHGAGWNFVIWGGLHGVYLCVNQAYRTRVVRSPAWTRPFYAVLTMLAVMFAWVFFRAPNLAASGHLLSSLIGANDRVLPASIASWRAYATMLVATGIAMFAPNTGQIFAFAGSDGSPDAISAPGVRTLTQWAPNYAWVTVTVLCGLASLALVDGETAAFVYYKF